ncbi:glucans biosynthesis protein [Devosia crocina]|uniref:Glucans biosynthesis protein n=2 Tax=Devosia crocina TaxID=429728 RepID=A0A1I7NUQ6_9HYPH|nr:glucans biosynthesis protein [Devosia crocina]
MEREGTKKQNMPPLQTNTISRRTLLSGAVAFAALLSTTAMTRQSVAATPVSGAFDFESFTARMRDMAAQPYQNPELIQSPVYEALDYDGHRRVQFDTKKARWLGDDHGFQIQAFPPGWLFKETVSVYEITSGDSHPFAFDTEDFIYHFDDKAERDAIESAAFPGIAGFRINYPMNKPDVADELVAYLGASYFRALGRGNIYGSSARGLLINSWRDGPEEFPRFSEFYLERPTGPGPMTLYAALESHSVTGAYRFVISPADADQQETVMDVTARLFFREDVAEVGIAPLTSMFLFADTNRSDFDDFRPQVHDCSGLVFEPEAGLPMWRQLNNSPILGNSYFWDANMKAFGLYQRNRNFEDYQDAGAHYERRPSMRVEPTGDWGQGQVRLIEIPARSETDDNIAAFWIPKDAPKAGEAREYGYRLIWGDLVASDEADLAHVVETRIGQGGVSGVENAASLRKFVIDFAGGRLPDLSPDTLFDVNASVSAGEIIGLAFSQIEANGLWRLVLDVETIGESLIELKASISAGGEPLTEAWLYQWRGEQA